MSNKHRQQADPAAGSEQATRLQGIDALRGLAMVWMTVFHFCFDLQYFGLIRADFYQDTFWTWQRSMIVSLFVFCAGLGQAVALHQGQSWQRFWRRWGQVVLCALLVSAASYAVFPRSFIYFGILHGLALMLLLTRALAPWLLRAPVVTALVAGLALATPWWAQALHQGVGGALQVLDTPALNWLGVIGRKPITEDYAPLLPWVGMMWWGLLAGAWYLRRAKNSVVGPARLWPVRGMATLGRWSLSYYMLHQPVLMGCLMLYLRFTH